MVILADYVHSVLGAEREYLLVINTIGR